MSPTRRDVFKVAGITALAAAGPVGARIETEQRPTGRKHDHVVLGTTRPGWTIHKGLIETDAYTRVRIDGCSMIRTDGGAWSIAVKPDIWNEWLIDVTVDDPGAIAFLDAFTDLMTDPPAGGKYRFSDLTAQEEGVQ